MRQKAQYQLVIKLKCLHRLFSQKIRLKIAFPHPYFFLVDKMLIFSTPRTPRSKNISQNIKKYFHKFIKAFFNVNIYL